MMNITVMGTGYVGLVTGATLSDAGHQVTCLDIIESKVNELNQGKSPIFEPGLEELIIKNSKIKTLKFSNDIRKHLTVWIKYSSQMELEWWSRHCIYACVCVEFLNKILTQQPVQCLVHLKKTLEPEGNF